MTDFYALAPQTPLYLLQDFAFQGAPLYKKGQQVFYARTIPAAYDPNKPVVAVMVTPTPNPNDKIKAVTASFLTDVAPTPVAPVASAPAADDDGISGAVNDRFTQIFDMDHALPQALFADYIFNVENGREDLASLDMAIALAGLDDTKSRYTLVETAAIYRQLASLLQEFELDAESEDLIAEIEVGGEPAPPPPPPAPVMQTPTTPAKNPPGRPKKDAAPTTPATTAPAAPQPSTPGPVAAATANRKAWTPVKVDALSLIVPGMAQAYVNAPENFDETVEMAKKMVLAAVAVQ